MRTSEPPRVQSGVPQGGRWTSRHTAEAGDLDLFEPEPEPGVADEPDTLGGEAEADYAVRRLAAYRRQEQHLRGQHKIMIDRYNAWLVGQLEKLQHKAGADEQRLRMWMEARLEVDHRAAKTVELPSGTVSLRKGSTSVDIPDQQVFLAWAEQLGRQDLIRRPEPKIPPPAPDKEAIRKLLQPDSTGRLVDPETGAVAPATLVKGDPTVTVRFDDEKASACRLLIKPIASSLTSGTTMQTAVDE